MDRKKNPEKLSQYLFAAESIDRSRERRQRDNRFFLVLLTGVATLAGAGQNAGLYCLSNSWPASLLFLILWSAICMLWQVDLILYHRSNFSLFEKLREIEGEDCYVDLFRGNRKLLDEDSKGKPLLVKHNNLSLTRKSLPSFLFSVGLCVFGINHIPIPDNESSCKFILWIFIGVCLYVFLFYCVSKMVPMDDVKRNPS